MATGTRNQADAAPEIDTKADESPEIQNPPAEPQEPDLKRSASGAYRVLTSALVLADDKEGKNARHYLRGSKITPGGHVDVDRLLAMRAIEPFGTKKESVGPTNAMHLARAANALAQSSQPEFLEDGDDIDDANEGDGS